VSRQYPDAIKIFITAPSLSILKKRLKARGSEIQKDVKLRLQTARKELSQAKAYDCIIVNDHLNDAFKKLESIIQKAVC
jgi:guanylate kinase